jgi:hypothetical protein
MATRTYTKEADVKSEVKKLLKKHGWFFWMPPMNGYGQSGVSDFNALRAGVFLAIETKFGTNKPSPMQKGYLQSITAEGGFGFVVSDRTIGQFAEWLSSFDAAAKAVETGGQPSPEDGARMLNAIAAMTEPTL